MAADLRHLSKAQAGLMGCSKGGAAEAVAAQPLNAHLLRQLADGGLGATDTQALSLDSGNTHPFFVEGNSSRQVCSH